MKIAVTGKGGVGKTTVAAILARLYAEEGRNVLAVDVDPDANLGLALGFSEEELESITPISKMKELIQDRTGVDPEGISKMFRLNPKVDDIPEKFAKTCNGVKLLVLGTVDVAGAGCVCPEHVILKQLISHLVIQNQDVVIMDMEAGLEHLGRGTTSFMDRFIVVVEPGTRSIQTFKKVRELAFDLGIPRVEALANKVRGPEDEEFIRNNVAEDELLGFVHYSNGVIEADRQGRSPFEMDDAVVSEIRRIKEKIDKTH
ncbi:MAG: AAA family ATPase [Clostridiales bacterium]|jgi:CO dehydrogenase maturation factor|nr:AAA family ATPase [Clostridiales bacterium]